jgi:hypothetical protein
MRYEFSKMRWGVPKLKISLLGFGGRGVVLVEAVVQATSEIKQVLSTILHIVIATVGMAYSSQESTSFHEKKSHFRGSALIDLKHLVFESDQVPGTRALDHKNVARLVQIFELEGCHRLEPEHHVPAIISEKILSDALQRSQVSQAALLKHDQPPRLRFDDTVRLTCLHGKHRLAAADEFLLPGDKLWVVDLYKEGIY